MCFLYVSFIWNLEKQRPNHSDFCPNKANESTKAYHTKFIKITKNGGKTRQKNGAHINSLVLKTSKLYGKAVARQHSDLQLGQTSQFVYMISMIKHICFYIIKHHMIGLFLWYWGHMIVSMVNRSHDSFYGNQVSTVHLSIHGHPDLFQFVH